MKKFAYYVLLAILIVSCESPMKIQINELDNIIGSSFDRSVLKEGGDCSIGYYNGNITTVKVELSWSQTTEEDFIFYKLTRDNNELAVFNNRFVTSFTDTLVVEDVYYEYQITVFVENGMVAKDTIEVKTAKWQAPSNLTANALSDTDIKLMWDDNTDSEEYFKIYFYDNSERSLLSIFTIDANVTEKIVTDLDPLETYYFDIKAIGQWEEDTLLSPQEWFDMSNFVFFAPSDLICNQNNDISIQLNWEDNSTLETGFSVERKINNSEFTEIAEIDMINSTSYTDNNTTAYEIGDTLTYRVRAYNDYEYPTEYTEYSDEYVIIIIEPSTVPTPEYFFSGGVWENLEIDYPGETDVIEWTSYGSDLDIELYNNSSTMDLAIKIWDEYGNFIGEFNNAGTGDNEYFPNIADGNVFIIEIFDVNNTSGYYEIYLY